MLHRDSRSPRVEIVDLGAELFEFRRIPQEVEEKRRQNRGCRIGTYQGV